MALKLNTAPAVEPVSLTEVCSHLRIDADGFEDQLESSQSIAPGDHVIAASYTLKGSGVSVAGKEAVVIFESGTNGAGGTVDVKLQESDTDSDTAYTDVASGAFTQVTTANDNATYEKAYTGSKAYIRAVATVAGNTCDFGVSVVTNEPTVTESTYLQTLIKAAREYCQNFQNRAYVNQTWELWLDQFPDIDYIELPLPPLSSVTSVKYYGTDNTEYTLSADDYSVDVKSEPGKVYLRHSKSWPTTVLRPYQGVCVTYVAGYGATAAYTPQAVKQAMLLLIGHWYNNREAAQMKADPEIEFAVSALLWQDRML